MPHSDNFDFTNSRRLTEKELQSYKKAIEKKLKVKRPRRGRPAKPIDERCKAISIRLHPNIIKWAKKKASKLGVGYQTVINEELLKLAA